MTNWIGRYDENAFMTWLQQISLKLVRTYRRHYRVAISSPHQCHRLFR